MIVGCFQCQSPAGDLSAGFAVIERALGQAAASGVEMLVMPEALLPGYASYEGRPFDSAGAVAQVAEIVRRHGVALTFGHAEVTEGAVYNTATALGADGATLASYRKVQLWGPQEREVYAAGDGFVAFDYRGHRFGLLICYDVEFPEHVRALAQAGCQTLLVPTANSEPYVYVNLLTVPCRANENAIAIAYANYCGTEGALTYSGRSLIASRDGPPAACMGVREGLILADVGELSLASAELSTQLTDLRRDVPVRLTDGGSVEC